MLSSAFLKQGAFHDSKVLKLLDFLRKPNPIICFRCRLWGPTSEQGRAKRGEL